MTAQKTVAINIEAVTAEAIKEMREFFMDVLNSANDGKTKRAAFEAAVKLTRVAENVVISNNCIAQGDNEDARSIRETAQEAALSKN